MLVLSSTNENLAATYGSEHPYHLSQEGVHNVSAAGRCPRRVREQESVEAARYRVMGESATSIVRPSERRVRFI